MRTPREQPSARATHPPSAGQMTRTSPASTHPTSSPSGPVSPFCCTHPRWLTAPERLRRSISARRTASAHPQPEAASAILSRAHVADAGRGRGTERVNACVYRVCVCVRACTVCNEVYPVLPTGSRDPPYGVRDRLRAPVTKVTPVKTVCAPRDSKHSAPLTSCTTR